MMKRWIILGCVGLMVLFGLGCEAAGRRNTDGSTASVDGGSGGAAGGCMPQTYRCEGNSAQRCTDDGSGWTEVMNCDPALGQVCAPNGTCQDLCRAAESSNSYIGCEYWPTTIANTVNRDFPFAVVVTNPQSVPATVAVDMGGTVVAEVAVAAGAQQTIELPWVTGLKEPSEVEAIYTDTDGMEPDTSVYWIHPRSRRILNAAYRLRSSVPVTVYQFSPLEYQRAGNCSSGDQNLDDNLCFSYSNDASLLLPTHVLTGNYIVMSRPTMLQRSSVDVSVTSLGLPYEDYDQVGAQDNGADVWGGDLYSWSPGVVTIVAVDSVPTEVNITMGGNVAASSDGRVSAYTTGQSASFTLQPGEVLQLASGEPPISTCASSSSSDQQDVPNCGTTTTGLPIDCRFQTTYCNVGDDYDLTGTEIRSEGRLMVLGGHQCDFVPYNRWACDHLEESMFPLESWGQDFIVSITEPLRGEPNIIRIVSGDDNNTISFEPPVFTNVTLNRGATIEFEASQDFRVQGTGALMVGQFLVGQDYAGRNASGAGAVGDPAMSLAIPTEQFRDSYSFLAPTTFAQSYVNVTAPSGQRVFLSSNGGGETEIDGWRAVGSTGMQTARVSIPGGSHAIRSDVGFGIVVYGFGSYTSYMYPGGLDLREINVPF